MNGAALIARLAAEPPQVLIVDSITEGRIVHAIHDRDDEPRREVFVMSSRTWRVIERAALLISPRVVGRWTVCRAKDVGMLSPDGSLLILPLPVPFSMPIDMESDAMPPMSSPVREWSIPL